MGLMINIWHAHKWQFRRRTYTWVGVHRHALLDILQHESLNKMIQVNLTGSWLQSLLGVGVFYWTWSAFLHWSPLPPWRITFCCTRFCRLWLIPCVLSTWVQVDLVSFSIYTSSFRDHRCSLWSLPRTDHVVVWRGFTVRLCLCDVN